MTVHDLCIKTFAIIPNNYVPTVRLQRYVLQASEIVDYFHKRGDQFFLNIVKSIITKFIL
jgi:hypothetical protein